MSRNQITCITLLVSTLMLFSGVAGVGQVAAQDTVRILTPSNKVSIAVYSPDGRYLVTGGSRPNVQTWDLQTGRIVDSLEIRTAETYGIEFFPDGDHVLLSMNYQQGVDSVVKWNWREHRRIWAVQGMFGTVSHGGDTVVYAKKDGTVTFVGGGDGRTIRRVGKYIESPLGFRMNKRGNRLLYYAGSRGSALIDLESGKSLIAYRVEGGVWSGRFSPDDKVVAAGSTRPIVFDAETGDSLFSFADTILVAYDLAYSPDGQYIVTTCFDASIRLWDARTGDSLMVLGVLSQRAYGCEFSPDGKYVATASVDDTIRIWPIPKRPSSVRRLTSVRNTMNVNAFPDPSLDRTTVEYTLERPTSAQLRLVNAMGCDVLSLTEPQREPGTYRVALDVSSIPSGIYFIVVTAGAEQSVRPLRVAR